MTSNDKYTDGTEHEMYRCATSEKILMNINDGLFPQWAWDIEGGTLVARCDSSGTSDRLEGEDAYRLLMQALDDCTANVERVCPRATPFDRSVDTGVDHD